MESIWMGIAPSSETTRVIAMAGPERHDLEGAAREGSEASPGAWRRCSRRSRCGKVSRSALRSVRTPGDFRATPTSVAKRSWTTAAPSTASSGSPPARTASGGIGLHGLGNFRDLERLLLSEVAR